MGLSSRPERPFALIFGPSRYGWDLTVRARPPSRRESLRTGPASFVASGSVALAWTFRLARVTSRETFRGL